MISARVLRKVKMVDNDRKKFVQDLVNAAWPSLEKLYSGAPAAEVPRIYDEGMGNIQRVSEEHRNRQTKSKTLKEILDNFGWERVQQGELPPEIKSERYDFVREVHQWDLYALNGVCVLIEDDTTIFDLFGIKKTPEGYRITTKIPLNTVVRVPNIADFLEGFKHLHGFRHTFLWVKEGGMHFDGIGKRIEEAGELYKS